MIDYFKTSPDWAEYAGQNGMNLADSSKPEPLSSIIAPKLDIQAQRAAQTDDEAAWVAEHSLSLLGYESRDVSVSVRDGAAVGVKISWPITDANNTTESAPLPVVFVTHGGGWIQGTHHTEERWILWPLFKHFKFISISVDYRLAPEHAFPTWHNDSFGVLQKLYRGPDTFFSGTNISPDIRRVILAGSSAGAGIAAVMAQKCRDQGIKVRGVILNVPVLCDYRHLPQDEIRNFTHEGVLSWEQCTGAALSSGVMKAVWDLVLPSSTEGASPEASPLLGDCSQLPEHLIFAAGQDPLCDEARYYAQKLSLAGTPVSLIVYPGVPHAFAETHHLQSTQKFWVDFQTAFKRMVST